MNAEGPFDVMIAGGGSAGLAAALASARCGARTLMIERQQRLGGMGSNAMVHTICGLFHPDVSRGPQWLNPGIPTEIGQQLLEMSGQKGPDLMEQMFVLRHHPAMLASLAKQLCDEERSLTVWANTELVGIKQGEAGWQFTVQSSDGAKKASSRALVDTTGDAILARLLGRQHWEAAPSEKLSRPAFVCCLTNVEGDLNETVRAQISTLIDGAVRNGTLPMTALGATFRQAPTDDGDVFMTIDLVAGGAEWNPLDEAHRKQLEADGAELAAAIWRFLRHEHPLFEHCGEAVMPTQAGIRESARWVGDYVLTGQDLKTCRRFPDEAALAGWPMEFREDATGPKFVRFDKPEPAGIPMDCVRTSRLPGVFFAGRCLSCDHEALASVRVMGTCLATGQAAGRLAANASK